MCGRKVYVWEEGVCVGGGRVYVWGEGVCVGGGCMCGRRVHVWEEGVCVGGGCMCGMLCILGRREEGGREEGVCVWDDVCVGWGEGEREEWGRVVERGCIFRKNERWEENVGVWGWGVGRGWCRCAMWEMGGERMV